MSDVERERDIFAKETYNLKESDVEVPYRMSDRHDNVQMGDRHTVVLSITHLDTIAYHTFGHNVQVCV